uniref:Uncharacterized protein n=1 Tax=Panagrellus redivivus TaxID=6233 RepID=A0A7E4VV40_PANRE
MQKYHEAHENVEVKYEKLVATDAESDRNNSSLLLSDGELGTMTKVKLKARGKGYSKLQPDMEKWKITKKVRCRRKFRKSIF